MEERAALVTDVGLLGTDRASACEILADEGKREEETDKESRAWKGVCIMVRRAGPDLT